MPRVHRSAAKPSRYAVHPGIVMEQRAIEKLKAKTGRSLNEWVTFIRHSGPSSAQERTAWLKRKFKIGTNYAAWLAERAEGKSHAYKPAALVEQMFSGQKIALRPIYDRILDLAFALGDDVTVTPCATIVPIRRRYVIAQVKPSTNTRIDLGFALRDTKVSGRLIDTGGLAKKDRITHRIPITSMRELDAEVERWLRRAYEMDA